MEPQESSSAHIWADDLQKKTEIGADLSHRGDSRATQSAQNFEDPMVNWRDQGGPSDALVRGSQPVELVRHDFVNQGQNHDQAMGQDYGGDVSHPVFYDDDTKRVYKGAPSQYHTEAIAQHPDLANRFQGRGIFEPPRGMSMGRVFRDSKELHWYQHPPEDVKPEIHDALGAMERPSDTEVDPSDIWSDSESPSEQDAFARAMYTPDELRARGWTTQEIEAPTTQLRDLRHGWVIETDHQTAFARIWNNR